nr:DUF3046 domain-containing protein [Propionibacterium sp.]
MRETELRRRLVKHLGAAYASAWAAQTTLGELGSRTVEEAIADGVDFARIWRAVWSALDLPESER